MADATVRELVAHVKRGVIALERIADKICEEEAQLPKQKIREEHD